MYYGYAQIWLFRFVPVGFAIVMAAFVALCLVYAVGASRGKAAAQRYLRVTMALFWAAFVADLAYALLSGELQAFLTAFGASPLVEMGTLAALCIGSMWFMGARYIAGKPEDEAVATTADEAVASDAG